MHTALDDIFGSRIRAKLISWMFSHCDESFSCRQLTGLLHEKGPVLGRELARMSRSGLLLSEREGKCGRYRTNPDFVLYPELKELALKTVGVAGQLSVALAQLTGVRYAFVYGPCARGEEQPAGDIDLMIIGVIDCDRLDELMEGAEGRLGRTINCMVYDPDEFAVKMKARNRFLLDVMDDDLVMLAGRRDGLAAL